MAPPRSRVGKSARGFAAPFPLLQSGQGMAPMHLAAAEAGGASRKLILAQEKGVVRAQRSEPRSLQKSALRRARGGPLALL